MAKKPKNTGKKTFVVGDIVLAKVKGYPLWPAKVIDIPNPGKYYVQFYATKDTGKSLIQIKPFDASALDPKSKNALLKKAYGECQKQYDESMLTEPKESPNHSPKHLEIDNNQEAMQSPLPNIDEIPTKVEWGNDQKIIKPISEKPDVCMNYEEIGEPQSSILSPSLKDIPDDPLKNKETDNNQEVLKFKLEESTQVDYSLNDLTSEQANADRGVKKPATKSLIVPDNSKVRTIEKLKKKLQQKLDEKAGKKKHAREKLEFKKASERLLKKFETKYNLLIVTGKEFTKKPNAETAKMLKESIKNCEKRLDLLNRCVIAISSEYGRKQSESREFHEMLKKVVETLNDIRHTCVGSNQKDVKQMSKRFRKSFKSKKDIREFVNKSDEHFKEIRKEQVVERKENARKRRKTPR